MLEQCLNKKTMLRFFFFRDWNLVNYLPRTCNQSKMSSYVCSSLGDYQTISLISHPSKVMLKIILNRLKLQAEKIITEEQAGFRAGRSTTEQIFQLTHSLWEISPAPARPLPCLHRLGRPLTGFGMQLCGQPWRSTTSATTLSKSSKISMRRPLVPSSSTVAQETGSKQQLESNRGVNSHPPSSTYFWKGSWQTP